MADTRTNVSDKLADTLKNCLNWMEDLRACGDAGYWDWKDGDAYTTGMQALTAHEAAKSATPDDVRETILDLQNRIEYRQKLIANNFAANNFITVDIPDLQTLINAALRQGVTLPRDKADRILHYCDQAQEHTMNGNVIHALNQIRALLDQHARGG